MPSSTGPWLSRFTRRRLVLTSLDEHPNLHEILGILAQVPRLTERQISRLAHGWRDNTFLAGARDHALSPDAPLIVDVLAAFDRADAVFFDDLGDDEPEGQVVDAAGTALKPHLVNTALKAIRDALAAAYARPILSRAEYVALMGPWRCTFPADGAVTPSGIVTRTAAVEQLLDAMSALSSRCHNAHSHNLFADLAEAARRRDPEATGLARETAWRHAAASGRRRQWSLLRQTAHDAVGGPCPACREACAGPDQRIDEDRLQLTELVRSLCADAVCGLLMADALDPATVRTLVDPAAKLLPSPRMPAED
jgi:hypothetical protein